MVIHTLGHPLSLNWPIDCLVINLTTGVLKSLSNQTGYYLESRLNQWAGGKRDQCCDG